MSTAEQAQLLMALGFSCRAVAMYRKLIATEPTTENYLMLAELYAQQGLSGEAAEMHTKAITLMRQALCCKQETSAN